VFWWYQLQTEALDVCRMQVLLNGITKSYPQGYSLPPVAAISGLWLRVWPGECFGLLGVNGAGEQQRLHTNTNLL
jgi:ABC-type uncharacterized transport system ATPase subunit